MIRRLLTVLIVTLLGLGFTGISAQAGMLPGDVVVQVQNGQSVMIYAQPSLTAPQVGVLASNTRFLWRGALQQSEGRNWMPIITSAGVSGWISPNNEVISTAYFGRVSPGMQLSAAARVPQPISLYPNPGFSSVPLTTLPSNSPFTVTEGPAEADYYRWWKVRAGNFEGWLSDAGYGIQVDRTLSVYNHPVCDGVDITRYGVPGWDSSLSTLEAAVRAPEQIVCLASTNLRGDKKTPIVVVLSRIEITNNTQPVDTLRVFEPREGSWVLIMQQQSEPFARTLDVSVFDFEGTGKPFLIWNVVRDGTGSVLLPNIYQYLEGGALISVFSGEAYKGGMQWYLGGLTLVEPDYLPDEPNCCASGIHRTGFIWANGAFTKVFDEVSAAPYALQSRLAGRG